MRTLILLLAAFVPALVTAQNAPPLASLRNKNRVLLIFASSDRLPDFRHQVALLANHSADLEQRDLVVISVTSPTSRTDTDTSQPPIASATDLLALRHRFHVAADQFTVILIGKDGGEKLRKNDPITLDKLNAVIDAMPMRRDEMSQRKP